MTENGTTQRTSTQSRYCVRFLNHECVIDTSHDLLTEWNVYIPPFFDISREIKESFIRVRVEEKPEYVQHILHNTRMGAESILHCDMAGKIVEEPDQTIVTVPELQTVYRVQSSDTGIHINYVCTRFSTLTSLDLLRLVRGVLVGLAETGEMRKAHMSIVALENRGIGFIGGKNSGKTSFMLAFLKQFAKSSFVSNDKVLLNADGKAFGLPYAVSIGFGALKCCKEIPFTKKRRVIDEKAYYWPEELAQYLGRTVTPFLELSSLLHVSIDPGDTTLHCSEITDYQKKKKVIMKHVFHFSDKVTPHWLLDILDIRLGNQCVDWLLRIPLYTLWGNPWNGNMKRALEYIQE